MQQPIQQFILIDEGRTNYIKSKLSVSWAVLLMLIFVVFVSFGCSANNKKQIDYGKNEIADKFKLLNLIKYQPYTTVAELATIKAPIIIMGRDGELIKLSHIINIFDAKHFHIDV